MTTSNRRRHPRVPEFPPLEQLVAGDPFNPNALFEAWSIRQAIGKFPKLGASTKYVYVMLVDQVYVSDYDWHSQAEIARLCGLSVDQIQRHLAKLKRARLVHVAPDLGRQNYLWLLYHPVFALCSPLTHRISAAGVTAEVRQGLQQKCGTQRTVQRTIQRKETVTLLNATSHSGETSTDRRRYSETTLPWEPLPSISDNGESVTSVSPPSELRENTSAGDDDMRESLIVVPGAKSFWYSLTPHEKSNRFAQAARVHDRILHLRSYLDGPDAGAARQARMDISNALRELRDFGFTLHTNGKGQ